MDLSDRLVRALLDSAPDAMVIADESGTIVFVNSQTETLFGYAREELLGQPVEVLLPERFRHAHPGHRSSYAGAPRKRPMGGNLELYARRRDGSEFSVEISLSPLPTERGLLVSSAIRDTTERKHILEQLEKARNEAEKANRAKSAFLAAASHDLRQPLQTLILLNSVLERTTTDPRAVMAAATQRDALTSMSELINALLDISKLDAGTIHPTIEDFSLNTVFRQLQAAFGAEARAKGLSFDVEHCKDDVVRSDRGLLEQIVQNLVANAIRYTPAGSVQLRCIQHDSAIRIEVADTGIGIPSGQTEVIFEEFHQLNREAGEKREGLGLGLAIVRRISQLLEHPIEVRSQVGRGSCFAIVVPRGNGADVALEREHESSAATQGAFILLVDDDPAVAKATKLLLELEGHEVLAAASLVEVTSKLNGMQRKPELVVSDFHLANAESGIEVIQYIRRETGALVPAVLVTGDTSRRLADAAQRIGHCEVLSKPVVPDEFLSVIERLLREEISRLQ